MAKTWADFDEEVIPHVPSCPLDLARIAVKRSAIQFFKESLVWRVRSLQPLDIVAAQQDYTFGTTAATGSIPALTVVAKVYELWYNDVLLQDLTPEQFRSQSNWDSEAGAPESFTSFSRGTVSLWPTPEESVVDYLDPKEVALAPAQAATGIEDVYFEDHMVGIAKGARALLLAIQKKPWTNLVLAEELQREFEAYIGSSQVAGAKGYNRGRLRVTTRYRI